MKLYLQEKERKRKRKEASKSKSKKHKHKKVPSSTFNVICSCNVSHMLACTQCMTPQCSTFCVGVQDKKSKHKKHSSKKRRRESSGSE